MKLFQHIAVILVTLFLTTACGQKGPLFMVDKAKVNQAKNLKKAIEEHKENEAENTNSSEQSPDPKPE